MTGPDTNAEPAAPPRVPEDARVYAVGDIHGCADLLDELHDKILADAEARPAARRVVIYLGDYVDRGPDSKAVIDRMLADALPGFEQVRLIGNHEEMLLRFLGDPDVGPLWMYNGGAATCRSYGVDLAALPAGEDHFLRLRRQFAAALPAKHRRFFDSLVYRHEEGDYAFVHAGIRPGMALARQDPEDLLWIREPFLYSDRDHGKVIVHGHTPVDRPELRHNRIGIDTGAVFGGALTALVMAGSERRLLQAGGE
jgi:serine/threonine protein phosphatase 1